MTAPRQVVAGRSYLVSRRCTQRLALLLAADRDVRRIFLYCLGEAAQRYEVTLHAWVAMSNHAHLVVRDNKGNLPEFLAHFHKLVAKALNAHWERCENFWSNEQVSVVYLVEGSDRLEKLLYVLANPVAADLVDKAADWPGASSVVETISGKPTTVPRPAFFREEGPMPETVTLRAERLHGFENLSARAWAAKITTELKVLENAARASRVGRVVGVANLRKARHTDKPKNKKKDTSDIPRGEKLNPHIACKNDDRRIDELRILRGFRAAYRRALALWHDRVHKVVFPAGTYRMKTLAHCRVDRVPSYLRAT